MCWQRARKPEQIEERRRGILDAAAELFAEKGYNNVSLNAIARRAGCSKSNVYRYFSTREEIFLSLYLDSFAEWVADVTGALDALPVGTASEAISRLWIDVTFRHERFLELIPQLVMSMEQNCSEEGLFDFKVSIFNIMEPVNESLHRLIPGITDADMNYLRMFFHVVLAGVVPAMQPNETLQLVMERPELSSRRVDYREFIIRTLSVYIDHVREKSEP